MTERRGQRPSRSRSGEELSLGPTEPVATGTLGWLGPFSQVEGV